MGLFGNRNKGNRTEDYSQPYDYGFVVNNFGLLLEGSMKIEDAINNGSVDADKIIRDMERYDGYRIDSNELIALMLANLCSRALGRTNLMDDELIDIFDHRQISETRAKEMLPIYSAYLKRCS
jgi:hypothetical protein